MCSFEFSPSRYGLWQLGTIVRLHFSVVDHVLNSQLHRLEDTYLASLLASIAEAGSTRAHLNWEP